LLIKLSLTLENFIAKYQKVCEISWAKLGTNEKTRSGVPLSPQLTMTAVKVCVENFSHLHYDMASIPYKIYEWFSMFS